MLDWIAAYKSPDVLVKRIEFLLYLQDLFCVADRGFDFETVTNDSGIAEKTLDVLVVVTRDFRRLKGMECFAVVFAFVQDCLPAESCLCALQYEKFEQGPVIVHRDTPLFIMIFSH